MQQQHSVRPLAVSFCLSDHQITRDHPITRFPAVKGFGFPINVISGKVLPFTFGTFGNFGDSGNPVAYNDAVTILAEPSDMPIFEYVCQQCSHQFEAIVLGTQKAACPRCESKRLSQQLSSFAVRGEKSQKSDAPGGACGSCGDPRGPGACSMN